MPNEFHGERDELAQLLSKIGYVAEPVQIANGWQWRFTNGAILDWYPTTGTLRCQGSPVPSQVLEQVLATTLAGPPSEISGPKPKQVFVVHGHDEVALDQLRLCLTQLDVDHSVLSKQGGGGLTLIEALEQETNETDFGIVLLTRDDMGYSRRDGSDHAMARARQNVVLEMGMLISALGRSNVAILRKGDLESPSDAAGIIYIPFENHVKETVLKLCDRLKDSGFQLDSDKIVKAAEA